MLILLSKLISALPLAWALALGRGLGWVWWHLLPIRVGVARANVRRVFGTSLDDAAQRQMVRRCITLQALNAIEVLRMPSLTPARAMELVEQQGFEHMHAALALGRGVIVITAHLGNLEMGACSQAIAGYPLHAIAKELHWKPAQDFVRAVRERTGISLIPPRRSKEMIRTALANREIVAFAFDQHMAAHRAVVCDFFGQLASTSTSPVRFAFETGAPILPSVTFRKGDTGQHVVRIEPPFALETPHDDLAANIRHNTERLNRVVERWVREQPEQWLWLHRRWKVQDDPAGWEIPAHLTHLLGAPRKA